jgi:hypothetical protein
MSYAPYDHGYDDQAVNPEDGPSRSWQEDYAKATDERDLSGQFAALRRAIDEHERRARL